jgi:signal transduction histidine kinase/CheY-like chemotaxis protein/HPt (histidine-containing phosphotransfer) domain-containing protein
MPSSSSFHPRPRPHVCWAQVPAALTVALGLSVLAGWSLGVPFLKSIFPDAVEIKANTGAGLALAGAALFILLSNVPRTIERLAQAMGVAVAAVGVATVCEYQFGLQLGIDELLFRDTATALDLFPGRMSLYSAVAFVNAGIGLAVFPFPRMRPLVVVAASAVTGIGAIAALGYAWNAGALATDRLQAPVPVHTALGFILLGVGTLFGSYLVNRAANARSSISASVETKILGGFVGSLLLLFLAGGFTYRLNAEFADTAEWVTHTQKVRASLGKLYTTISDAEAAQRNYLLTNDATHKAEYTRSISVVRQDEQSLVNLVSDNPAQLKEFSELRPFIARRLSALADHVAVFENERMAAVQRAIASDSGIRAKREIQIRIQRMDDAERVLLVNRQVALRSTREFTLLTLLGMLAVATAILTGLYLGIRRQIAARSAAEQALFAATEAAVSANRAKSTFLATMSHEIRTPMNGMLGMLELLGLTKLDAEQRTTLEIVRQSSRSLLRIIDDILDFSKIEAGKLELRYEVASIQDLIEDVHNIYSGNASSKGLLINRVADPRISPALMIDSLRLRQILNNLVSNALKFTSEGSIEIRAELVERIDGHDRVNFSVTDTGIGISEANQQRLFQPFSQSDCETTRATGGTGLGLTICRRLAELMGGSVEMTSEPGKGTTIVVAMSLPIADPKDLPTKVSSWQTELLDAPWLMRRSAPTAAEAEAEGTLVLLVDDHPTNRMLVCRQVSALGYAAESAENGVEALEKWNSGRFGIVITDCNMPQMDGYMLTRRIRAAESANGRPRIPVIACTANALAGEAEVCFAAGMDDYLVKPVELSHLSKKLEQWLPLPQSGGASASCAAQERATIDRSALALMCGGDLETEKEILNDFRRVNDDDARMLERAVAAGDIPQVARASHRILGASRMVGALVLADICEGLERATRLNDWSLIGSGMEAFSLECVRMNRYLDSI